MSETQSTATYRQQCASALTHPVTLGALGILLLNDLVFKALWSNPWTTGKLSDLGWVIFASPLLAWVLSLVARENRIAQRAVWVVAYAGLPLLYAAFNTFPTVHDTILQGLSLASGGTAGSPLDPTDSLVIPLGLVVAVWVWWQSSGPPGIRRQHIVMAVAGIAVVASIATSYPEPNYGGVSGFALTEQNTVLAQTGSSGSYAGYSNQVVVPPSARQRYVAGLETLDGGFTWKRSPDYNGTELEFSEQRSVDTPRGRFVITSNGVAHTDNTETARKEVYSTAYLSRGASEWTQIQTSRWRLKNQTASRHPEAIIYDPQSGNVIVAMGLQGVVVGTPDGKWTPVAVGSYRPTVYSRQIRMQTLLEAPNFWYSVILLPLAGTAVTVALTLLFARRFSDFAPSNDWFALTMPITAAMLGFLTFLLALYLLLTFDDFPTPTQLGYFAGRGAFTFIGCVLVIVAMSLCLHPIKLWHAEGVALVTRVNVGLVFLAMLACTALPFIMWIQLNVSPAFVHVSVSVLVFLTGFAMLCYLLSKRRLEPKASSPPPTDTET